VADGILVKALLVAALVAVLLPVCAMPLCGPMDGMVMGGGLSGLLDCPEMYFPGDVPAAVVFQAFALLFAAALVFLAAQMVPLASTSRGFAFSVPRGEPPGPPDDLLRGRLII
jgi:hypothetical protein